MNGQGGSYVIKEDQSVELDHRGGTDPLVNGRAEDEALRAKLAAEAEARDKAATAQPAPVQRSRVLKPAPVQQPTDGEPGSN